MEPVAAQPAVRTQGVSKAYGDHLALDDVSIDVPQHSLFAVLGPNGSGKSTLLKLVMGLEEPTSGTVEVFGQPPASMRGLVGYVPQASSADWSFPVTVREVVKMGLYGVRGRLRLPFRPEPRVAAALSRVGMESLAGRQVNELSGGQQRRVLIARALARDPQLLLLDEPAAGLDAAADAELARTLRGLADEGRTVVVATHDIGGVAEQYDDAVLIACRVIAAGPVATVLDDRHLHEAFGRQLLALHGVDHEGHHDVTFRQEHE